MALIKCSECSNEVSDKAATCPKCGNPILPVRFGASGESSNKSSNILIKILLSLIAVLFVMAALGKCSDGDLNEHGTNAEVEACVSRGIKYYFDLGIYWDIMAKEGKPPEDVARDKCIRATKAF